MSLGPWLDLMTLFFLISYGLSLVVAVMPVPVGDASLRVRARQRRLLLPPVAAGLTLVVGFGSGFPFVAHHGAGHPLFHAAGLGHEGTAHDAVVLTILAICASLVVWSAFQWGHTRGRLRLLEKVGMPHGEAAIRQMLTASGLDWPGKVNVVDFSLPICFVHGILRPHLVVSTAVLDGLAERDVQAMVAHELAHVTRRDNLWRIIGHLALLGHLPGLGRRAFRDWALAVEVACDTAAARHVGSSVAVAEALVHFQRRITQVGPADGTLPLEVAFHGSAGLETRVRVLLAPPTARAWQRWLQWWPLALLLLGAWQVATLHAGLDYVLQVLHP
ncbi:MAG: M56 family metallopeptidase [Candidatus Sericytochromatia bacterium]|nr:M56 family metallopeptidase [Candidatus Sericytochromatia bacterium]